MRNIVMSPLNVRHSQRIRPLLSGPNLLIEKSHRQGEPDQFHQYSLVHDATKNLQHQYERCQVGYLPHI